MGRNLDYVLLVSIFIIGLLVGLTVNGGPSFTGTVAVHENLNQTYTNAIDDAIITSDNEISTNLTPITENNSNLIWQNGSDKRVLVVLWTTHKSSYPTGGNITTYWGETWVTVVPEIKTFFKTNSIPEQYLHLRTAQLLGLPLIQWTITSLRFG
ncbi:MAG: hypothetical protein NKF70_03385 [Methanobacterium sp. ERen5]|nr:MAG: hypothetical protein NKF70_03385 [Methanobacterium sp. ERen5]